MLTDTVFQGSAHHRGERGVHTESARRRDQQENRWAEIVDTAQVADSGRPGVGMGFSGGHPQRTGLPVSGSRGWKGREITTRTQAATVHRAALCQESHCLTEALSQSACRPSTAPSCTWYVGEARDSGCPSRGGCHVRSLGNPKPQPCSHPAQGRCTFLGEGFSGGGRDKKALQSPLPPSLPSPTPPSLQASSLPLFGFVFDSVLLWKGALFSMY